MTVIKAKTIASALLNKGFKSSESHHTQYRFYYGGRKTIVKTYLSHGLREYDDSLLSQMKRQLGLTKQQLMDLINCPLSEDEYIAILLANGSI